jgi:SPP1 gp7 family putative phage head morphogenesis protein
MSFPQAHFERLVGSLTDGSPITTLAQRYGVNGPRIIREALLKGVATGDSPRVVARRINKALGSMYGDSSVLVRTELLRNYREGTRATYLANQRYVKGWIWCAALDTQTCPVCWAMHGTKHPLSEPMATHPVCRCSKIPDIVPGRLLAQPEIPLGSQSFRALDAASQRAILGPTAYRAYQQGMLDLPDLVRQTYSPVWGAGRAQRSLATVLGPQKLLALMR